MIRHESVRILKKWLQHKEDMTQTISSSSTTTQYPSAKAVYTGLNSKANKSNGASQITDTNSNTYSNIGTSTNATQQQINKAINDTLGDLHGIEIIKIVSDKGTASADTMNKLYIVSENNKVNVYYTKQNGNTYSWVKLDDNILDEVSVDWNDINHKPSIPSKTSDLTNDGDGTNIFIKNNDNRLSDSRNPLFNHIGASENNVKDLNESPFNTGGFYYCNSDTNEAPYIENQPLTTNRKSFFLLVETWGTSNDKYIKQTLTYWTNNATYIRVKSGARGWLSWIEISKIYEHPTYTALTGKPTSAQNPKFGGSVTISQIKTDEEGHVTELNDRIITIPNSLGNGTVAGLSTNNYTNAHKTKVENFSYNDLNDKPSLIYENGVLKFE